MKKFLLLISLFLLLTTFNIKAQCPIPNFSLPDTICTNQQINIINSTTGATSYFWDFCAGDLALTPTGTNLGNLNTSFLANDQLKIIKDNGLYYLFVSDWQAYQITRFELGSSLDNMPVSPTILNVSGLD
ncbi:MAG: hypothetical protein ACR2GN_04625, partial [Bacteroidia bacterium]